MNYCFSLSSEAANSLYKACERADIAGIAIEAAKNGNVEVNEQQLEIIHAYLAGTAFVASLPEIQ